MQTAPLRTTRFENALPILSVRDLAASVRYYVDVLGFANADWAMSDFTLVKRGGAGLYLCQGGQGHPGTWVWIGVDDAAGLYEEYRMAGAKLRGGLRNYAWAYELQVEDPDGHVLRCGAEPRADLPFSEGPV